MDITILQVSTSIQSTQGLVTSAHVANAVSEALRSCAMSIPGKGSNKPGPEVSGSPPRSPIESFYQAPQDVTAPPLTRRGTYSRPRTAPTITKSKRRVRKITGGGDDDESGYYEQLAGGGDGGGFWNGGSGSWGGSGGSGGSSGGRWGGGDGGGRGDRAGDESWEFGRRRQSIDWSRVSGPWLTGGQMNQRGLDALCALYYRSLCWISMTRCIYHVLISQVCMLELSEGMSVAARPSLAQCSTFLGGRVGNFRMAVAR